MGEPSKSRWQTAHKKILKAGITGPYFDGNDASHESLHEITNSLKHADEIF